jgi:hypothetical protein
MWRSDGADMTLDPWYKLVTPRRAVREGPSFNRA